MCHFCVKVSHFSKLPVWKAVTSKNNTWRGEPGCHYWHPIHLYRVVAYHHNEKVFQARACANCGGATKNNANAFCNKKRCGGEGERTGNCTHVQFFANGRYKQCPNKAHHRWLAGHNFCRKHFCQKRPDLACIRCRKKPWSKLGASKLCYDCSRAVKKR
jgi:hypothetical protein